MADYNPLSQGHQQIVVQGCDLCQQLRTHLDAMDRLGLDTQEMREKLEGFEHLFTEARRMWVGG